GRGGADRRAGRDADVDARVAGLPRALLAERRRDRPVDRPDQPARAVLDRAEVADVDARQLCLDLRLRLDEARDVVLELLAAVARGLQQRGLLAPDGLDAVAPAHERVAHAGDLVALRRDLGGDLRRLRLQPGQLRLARRRLRLGRADDRHDVRV